MAKINDVQIKNLYEFRGHEGECLLQGDIWCKGKKLGFWSEDANGGICDNFDFDINLLSDALNDFKEGKPTKDKGLRDIETFLLILSDLTLLEKEANRYFKCNRNFIVTRVFGEFTPPYYCTADKFQANEDVIRAVNEKIKEIHTEPVIFRSRDDFNITVDSNHPLPDSLNIFWEFKPEITQNLC